MKETMELLILMVAALSPFFYLAGHVDGDEFQKAATSAGQVAVVITIYKLYKSYQDHSICKKCGKKNKDCTCDN